MAERRWAVTFSDGQAIKQVIVFGRKPDEATARRLGAVGRVTISEAPDVSDKEATRINKAYFRPLLKRLKA